MKLATIEVVSAITPIANADAIELAQVLGWQTIVKKGQFTVGSKGVFIPIDTILPDAEWSAFLKKGDSPIRLKTIKMKGVYSQGLLMPLSILPENVQTWQDGADVGGIIGVKKYEKEIPACLSGVAKGNFPLYLAPKTDEDNGLSNPELVELCLQHVCQATLKLDGSSCTIIVSDGKIEHVCSRNLSLQESDNNGFWIAARKLSLSHITGRVVIQGELMGPGVQGNQLELTEPTLYVYQVKADSGWLSHNGSLQFASYIGAKHVEVVHDQFTGIALSFVQQLADSVKLPNGKPAEGIVVRPCSPIAMGIGRPLGFKIINRNYKDT